MISLPVISFVLLLKGIVLLQNIFQVREIRGERK